MIIFGIVWSLFWLTVLTTITNDPGVSGNADLKVFQTVCFFIMCLGVVPFGIGVARIAR